MHGKRKTLVLYVAIIGFGILVIQNTLLHLFEGSIAPAVAQAIMPALEVVNLHHLRESTVAINLAKIGASLIAALWNFFMLRKFVFVTKDDLRNANA